MPNGASSSRLRSITCVAVGRTRTLLSQGLISRPSGAASPIRRGAPLSRAATATLAQSLHVDRDVEPAMHPAPQLEHRSRTLQPAAADGNHFVERRMTGKQIGRPSFDHPGQMGLGQCFAQAQRTGNPCSTSPMALSRTIKIRGARVACSVAVMHGIPSLHRIIAQRALISQGQFSPRGAIASPGRYSSSSSWATRLLKCSSAVSTGPGCSMSTPASRSNSKGNFEQPCLRKLR